MTFDAWVEFYRIKGQEVLKEYRDEQKRDEKVVNETVKDTYTNKTNIFLRLLQRGYLKRRGG